MSVNVYIGATLILFVAVTGMIISIFAVRKRKSKLWIAPMFSLSMTAFTAVFMYFLLVDLKIMISPWAALMYVFAEIGALLGCYINENMESKSNLVRAVVIIFSVFMLFAMVMTLMLTVYENTVV